MDTQNLGKVIRNSVSFCGGIKLEYRLYRSSMKLCGRFSYSLALLQTDSDGCERIFAGDVSRTKRDAYRLFTLMSEGQVAACTFFEILEEIL